jgi:outer membrane protein assembly factor BamB
VFHCTPHPGLGTVVVKQVQVDLATCATSRLPAQPTHGPRVVGRTIVVGGKVVVSARKGDAVALDGSSGDGKWVLYAIDPFSSVSIAADGLPVRAVRSTGGPSYPIATGLVYASYRAWCGDRLVMTAGFDRETTTHKWLITSSPPAWGARPLVQDARRAFGSLACAPDGVVVQSTSASPEGFRSPHWSLWHIAWNGALQRLTSPPAGVSDESPQYAGGVLYFVRSGLLYAQRDGRLSGPLLQVPRAALSYFGHTDWRYKVKQ